MYGVIGYDTVVAKCNNPLYWKLTPPKLDYLLFAEFLGWSLHTA